MRLSYAAPDQPPEMLLTADAAGGKLPLTVTLDASRSYDPQRRQLSFEWNVDGTWVVGGTTRQVTFDTKGIFVV